MTQIMQMDLPYDPRNQK